MRTVFTVTAGASRSDSRSRWARSAEGAGARDIRSPQLVGARIHGTAAGWRSWEAQHDIYEGAAP